MPEPDALRFLIVADDPLVRAGLGLMLEQEAGCEIVGRLPASATLADELEAIRPDILLWDLGWEAEAGSLAQLADVSAAYPVIALLEDAQHAASAWEAGAGCLLRRDVSGAQLAAAAETLRQGLAVLDPALIGESLSLASGTPELTESLTGRELEVLLLVAEGLSNRAVAQRLGISEHTVKFHLTAIMGKLEAQSRTEAVVRATRLGLLAL